MNKKRNEKLIIAANDALLSSGIIKTDRDNKQYINESYNGQTAALGVTIAMTGLRPALAIYSQYSGDSKFDKKNILKIIGAMIKNPDTNQPFASAIELFRYALDNQDEKWLKREIIDCSIALKQVIRTYNLLKL